MNASNESAVAKINSLADIYLPKLQALANSGDGATIHDASHHLNVLMNTQTNIQFWASRDDDVRVEQQVAFFEKMLKKAIEWMETIARQPKKTK